jgi:hypothetical protein
MKAARFVFLICAGMVSTLSAQQNVQILRPAGPDVATENSITTIPLASTPFLVNKKPHLVTEAGLPEESNVFCPLPIEGAFGSVHGNRLSFNYGHPQSRRLMNPDQFWTRKSLPVIDSRNHFLFGDPRSACDEWAGYCGCCGFKMNPGHLGQRWLRSGDPCECVDDCCPERPCHRCRSRESK